MSHQLLQLAAINCWTVSMFRYPLLSTRDVTLFKQKNNIDTCILTEDNREKPILSTIDFIIQYKQKNNVDTCIRTVKSRKAPILSTIDVSTGEYNAGRIPRLRFVGRTMLIVNYTSNYAAPMPSFHSSYRPFGFVYARLFGSETDPGIYDLHTAAASLARPVVARDSARFSPYPPHISSVSDGDIRSITSKDESFKTDITYC